ncbi:MAG: polysaccharide biosynthesis protein [Clostridia bacterium]|nr:polysaccharide biosynthesis protein [Clostridia bacterium]
MSSENILHKAYKKIFHEGFKGSFTAGALILMGAGFAVRILGFVNRIYLSNLIGAEGLGLVQLASPVYALIILTLTSGVSITVSGMTARENARGNPGSAVKICKTAFFLLLLIGGLCGLGLFFSADFLSVYVLHDPRTKLSLMMLAPCIPAVAAASALKGYFYGMSKMTPTALSQIVEQVVRIGCIFALAMVIGGRNLEWACALTLISAAFGETANLCVVAIAFYREARHPGGELPGFSKRTAAKEVLAGAIPISFHRFLVSILGIVESVLLPARLLCGGLNYTESIETLGRISGMCMPLIAFPTLVTSALATTLVPAISQAVAKKNYKLANRRISRSIRLSFMMGFLCFALFYTFGEGIAAFCYGDGGVGMLLVSLSHCCILMYVQQTMNGILNGLGKQTYSLVSTLIGYGVRIAAIWFLVPMYGVAAYIWGDLAGMAIMVVLDLVYITRCTSMPLEVGKWILTPAIPGIAFAVVGKMLHRTALCSTIPGFMAAVTLCGLSAVAVYGLLQVRH